MEKKLNIVLHPRLRSQQCCPPISVGIPLTLFTDFVKGQRDVAKEDGKWLFRMNGISCTRYVRVYFDNVLQRSNLCFETKRRISKIDDYLGALLLIIIGNDNKLITNMMKNDNSIHITNVDVVCVFFLYVVIERRCNFRPDENFSEYVSHVDGSPMFTEEKIVFFNRLMDECFSVCEDNNVSIYDIGLEVLMKRIRG